MTMVIALMICLTILAAILIITVACYKSCIHDAYRDAQLASYRAADKQHYVELLQGENTRLARIVEKSLEKNHDIKLEQNQTN